MTTCFLHVPLHVRIALGMLTDRAFNSSEFMARIDSCPRGFGLTVENKEANAIARLFLCPESGGELVSNKMLDVREVLYILRRHLAGVLAVIWPRAPFDLVFLAEPNPVGNSIQLTENLDGIRQFPDIFIYSEATVSVHDLQLFAHHLLQQPSPHQASVEITRNTATIKVEGEDPWEVTYPMQQVNFSREVTPRNRYRASFQWTEAHLLRWLRQPDTDAEFVVRFGRVIPKCIVLSFDLPNVRVECMKAVLEPNPSPRVRNSLRSTETMFPLVAEGGSGLTMLAN